MAELADAHGSGPCESDFMQVRLLSPAPNLDSFILGWVPEWPKGADCKSVVTDFGGSNPPPSTKYAGMAELADAHGSGPCESDFMQVQVLFPAPTKNSVHSDSDFLLHVMEQHLKATVVNERPVDVQSRTPTKPAGENKSCFPIRLFSNQ